MEFRDRIKELRRLPASELLANPRNWRTHPQKQADALSGILGEIGWADACLARETSDGLMLIDGHLRAKQAGAAEIPVLVLDLTDDEADKLLLSLDALAGMAGTNKENLEALLRDVQTGSEGLAGLFEDMAKKSGLLFGGSDELENDEIPEPPSDPVTKLGDVWLLGQHRLVCGDSTDASVVGNAVGDTQPFLMVTDPPYGVEYDASWRVSRKLHNGGRMGVVKNDDRVDWTQAYLLFSGCVAYVWHASRYTGELVSNLHSANFEIRSQIIWKKPAFAISRGHYHWQHEPCWYAVRKGKTSKWCGDRSQSTIWEISNRIAKEESTDHSTQKPVECMARPIRNHGTASDVVYDPFLGSGSTLIASEQLERRCCGVELNPAYCDVIIERWQKLTGDKAKRRNADERKKAKT